MFYRKASLVCSHQYWVLAENLRAAKIMQIARLPKLFLEIFLFLSKKFIYCPSATLLFPEKGVYGNGRRGESVECDVLSSDLFVEEKAG